MNKRQKTRPSLERENEDLRAQVAALEAQIRLGRVEADAALEALRRSELQYRALHQTRIDAFACVSMDGRLQEFNERFQQMVGYAAEELRGLTYKELTPEKWHAREDRILESQVFVRGQSDLYEKEYRRKDGTVFPVELRTVLLHDPIDGTPTGMAAVVRDITERKRAEQALRESEEKFKTAFLTSVDACYISTLSDGRILEMNTAFEELFGYSRDEAIGRTSEELRLWVDYDERLRMRDELLAVGFIRDLEATGCRKNGGRIVCSLSSKVLRLQGQPCLFGVVHDVSERKRAEQALVESREALAESQQALLALINSTTDIIWSVDPHTFGLITFNNAFRDFLGKRGLEVRPGMTPAELLPAEYAAQWAAYFARAVRDGPFVEQYASPRGRPVWVVSFNVVKRGETTSAISVFARDITDRVISEQALRESEARFRTLIEDTPVAIRLNRGNRAIYANRRYLELYRFENEDQLLDKPVLENWAPESRADVDAHICRLAGRLDIAIEFEGTALRHDGTHFPAHAALGPIHLPDGPAVIAYMTDITDRQRAEQALRESEARFRTLIEDAPIAIRLSRDGGTLYANRSYLNLFGYDSVEQVVGTPIIEQWAPECREDLAERSRRNQNGVDVPAEYEGIALRKDGTRFPAHASVGLVQLPDGVALIVYVTDITDRKRAEDAVKASEEQYRRLFGEMIAGVMILDVIYDDAGNPVTYRFVGGNAAYEKMTGRSAAAEIGRVGKDYSIGWPPEVLQRFYDVATTGIPIQYERFNETIGRYFETRVFSPRRGQFAHVFTDITERKAAEAALRQSEERFRQVAETVSDFIWEVDAHGLYTYTSPAVEKILGYRPDELVGKKHFYDLFAEEMREELKAAAFKAFATKQPFRGFPNPNVSKDGRLVRLETSGLPLIDEAGRLAGYRGADSDVTQRWLSEQAVRDLTGRLINAQEAERSRVARELHDDFCQRLAVLAITLDLMRQSPRHDDPALQASVNDLHNQVQALARDVRRVSHDLHPARLEQLGLTSGMRGLCSEVTASHGLAVRYHARDVPVEVPDALALCLYRVAQEALQNVIKHSGAATATVELTASEGELHLVVSDDGCGFDVAAAQQGGTLGLPNMRERVRSIGGRLFIQCSRGEGTRVEVHAPLGVRS